MRNVYVVKGHSESGDHYVALFANKPTDDQLSDLCYKWDGDPEQDGPGDYGSYVHLTIDIKPVIAN